MQRSTDEAGGSSLVELEFWPEYGSGPLWVDGSPVDAAELLPADLAGRLATWNDAHADEKLPIDGAGDPAWMAEGAGLLAEVRAALAVTQVVVVDEPWWG